VKIDFKFFTNHLLKSEMMRGASVLITGTVLAQLISFLLQPVLRRFYSPETFGTFSVYLSIIGIITVFASLRYDDAIVLPKKDKDSANVVFLSLFLNMLTNLLFLLAVMIWGEKIIAFLNLPAGFSVKILYLIPLSVFLYNAYQSINFWLIRKKKFYSVSLNKIVRRGSEGIAQVAFALVKNSKGLIFSDIIGQSANVLTAFFQGIRSGMSLKLVSFNKIRYVARKYSDFPKYNLVPSLMSTCSYLLPPVFINKFFSSEAAGFFDLSKLLLSVPLALITASFSNVLLQKISERYNKRESFLPDLKPVFLLVGFVSVIEILVILIFGEGVFGLFFGKAWTYSGTISKILVWSFTFNFIVSTFTSLFVSMRKIRVYSIYQLFNFIAILSLLFFVHLEFTEFLKIYVLIEILCYVVVTIIMVSLITRYEFALNKTSKES
jgi:O-antigen/teichoic acid export membrane protein